MMMAMGMKMPMNIHNSPDADDKIINPPQSEESKQYYLKRAQEKRERRRLK
jgi:hypothetical protein